MPSTSTYALTHATLPYAVALADKGWQPALHDDASLALGLTAHAGPLTDGPVGDAVGIESVRLHEMVGRPMTECGTSRPSARIIASNIWDMPLSGGSRPGIWIRGGWTTDRSEELATLGEERACLSRRSRRA